MQNLCCRVLAEVVGSFAEGGEVWQRPGLLRPRLKVNRLDMQRGHGPWVSAWTDRELVLTVIWMV